MKVSEWQSADQKGLASTVFRCPVETTIAMFPMCERSPVTAGNERASEGTGGNQTILIMRGDVVQLVRTLLSNRHIDVSN
jgi:hypothetical protein